MAYTAVGMATSPTTSATNDITKAKNGLRRSRSSVDMCKRSIMHRSYSDNYLCCSFSRVHGASVQPKLKDSGSMGTGTSPFKFSGSVLPNSLRSLLFDKQREKDMVTEENMVESCNEERVDRANWIERLLEIKKHWRNRLPKESVDMDMMRDDNTSGEFECDDDDGVCMVDYDDEEEDGKEVTYNRESFSKFLVQVPWFDTKLYSQLAFLCNMAYEIPQIKVSANGIYIPFP